jgi:glycine/D-amino acid oxidase-like deaminating enzyme
MEFSVSPIHDPPPPLPHVVIVGAGIVGAATAYYLSLAGARVTLLDAQGRDLANAGEFTVALTRSELLNRIPGLGDRVLAGLKVPHDGHAIGYQVVNRLLAAAGITVRRNTPVRRLSVAHGRVIGVETDAGRLLADRVVAAAGIDSGPLLGLIGVMIPRKGQLIVTDRAAVGGAAFPGPLMSAGYLAAKRATVPGQSSVNLVIDPLATGQFLIGSSREEGLTDRQTDVITVSAILREALEVYPALARQRVVRTFAGIRATTSDGLPIIGRHPTLEGLIMATAMQGDGICLGPLVGGAVARLACDLEPTQDLSALSPMRFPMASIVD